VFRCSVLAPSGCSPDVRTKVSGRVPGEHSKGQKTDGTVRAALTEAAFRGVWGIQFMPDEELGASVDYSYAFYAAVVAEGDGLAVGYLEPMEEEPRANETAILIAK